MLAILIEMMIIIGIIIIIIVIVIIIIIIIIINSFLTEYCYMKNVISDQTIGECHSSTFVFLIQYNWYEYELRTLKF